MNRREFLLMPAALAVPLLAPRASRQTFSAGVVPSGRTSPGEVKDFWSHCDEVASLGFHRIEVNNTRAKIAEYYSDRVSEFTDAMAGRNLTLVGLAQFSRAAEDEVHPELIDQHMLLGRFLAAVGGKYVTHMIAPGPELNEAKDEAVYRQIDMRRWAENANAIGRRLLEQWGIKLAYHPEQAEVRSELYSRFLDRTDERYVYLLPDTGH
jgi:sugar phosphate isomerase/epimerase